MQPTACLNLQEGNRIHLPAPLNVKKSTHGCRHLHTRPSGEADEHCERHVLFTLQYAEIQTSRELFHTVQLQSPEGQYEHDQQTGGDL